MLPRIVCLLPLSVFAAMVATPSVPPADRVLDVCTADYLEDAAVPRAVAAVRAVLRARGDEVTVEVEVSAIGARVEPLPGVEGAPGANLRTAEELHFLLQDGQLAMLLRSHEGVQAGTLLRVERGRVPVRRLRGDGTIDCEVGAPGELPLRVAFVSPSLPAGRSRVWLTSGDMPRLCVECERSSASARIVAIESLGELPPGPVVRRRP